MCGITGIINKTQESGILDKIRELNSLVQHRGPDSSDIYFYKNLAFGHRRLSIIDLSSDGQQPMIYLDRYIITYNGEVYNYLELKAELEIAGYIFHTSTDTEVILAAFDYWGKECVNRFNGMWAFAILDKQSDNVFISRDRFGVKPLYYFETDSFFAFGSEIKQLLPLMEEIIVNEDVLIDYLAVGLEDHLENTFFRGIKKLPSSFSISFNLGTFNLKKEQFFKIELDNKIKELNEQESLDLYKKDFLDSIKLRLRSDVKVGACLSGGLDSSAIVHYASKLFFEETGEKFLAFHVVTSTNPKFNELNYVQELIKDLPIDLILIHADIDLVLKNVNEVIRLQEEPFGSPSVVLQYLLMQKAKSLNCKVLLDGQGGDETLMGYERYYASIFFSLGFFSKIKFIFDVIKHSKLNFFNLVSFFIYFSN
ncbi:MAG: asparagine synthase (glutamine-hydrolyzing), partial [Bacteroidota bacterium]